MKNLLIYVVLILLVVVSYKCDKKTETQICCANPPACSNIIPAELVVGKIYKGTYNVQLNITQQTEFKSFDVSVNGLSSKFNGFIAQSGQYSISVDVSGTPLKAGIFSLSNSFGCSVPLIVKDSV